MRRLITIIFTTMFCIGTIPAATAQAETVDEDRVRAEIRFRQNFGFRADEAFVRDLIASTPRDDRWPASLTKGERTEMDRRLAMQEEMEPLEALAESLPRFAGHWIDQAAGGVITVAFTGNAAEHRASLTRLVPAGAELRVVDVLYSLDELSALVNRIETDYDQLKSDGIQLAHWSVDISENRVVLGVVGLDDSMTETLKSRYGDQVTTLFANPQVTGCTGRESCIGPPLRAGISGAPKNTAYDGRCSIAFLIHYGSHTQWLTAGHCATAVAPANTACPTHSVAWCWYHAGNGSWAIGQIKATCWPNCNYSDAARGGNISNTYASNKVYLTSTLTFSVTGRQGFNADDEGDITCINARRAGYDCGNIVSIGTMDYGGVWFYEQRFANYQSYYGDSGGAVHSYPGSYYTVQAYGVHSGCTNLQNQNTCIGYGVYSHIYRVLQELGGSICSSSNPCP